MEIKCPRCGGAGAIACFPIGTSDVAVEETCALCSGSGSVCFEKQLLAEVISIREALEEEK